MLSKNHINLHNLRFYLLLGLGALTWYLTMYKSGLSYPFGLGFWGPNGHDGIWHISLAGSLSRLSLEMPIFAGSLISNYHIGYDLVLAFLHRVTGISLITLYFQILPLITALLVGWLTYKFIFKWTGSHASSLWGMFFVYFGGSWGWLVSLIRTGQTGGESMFWSQQSISTLINPPFAVSLIFILSGLLLIPQTKQKASLKNIIISGLIFGLLGQIKIYAAVVSYFGLLTTGILQKVKTGQDQYLKILIVAVAVFLIGFIPLNKNATNLLVWQPFWFIETMMGLSDRFDWPKFYQAMVTYKSQPSVKFFPAYAVALMIFLVGNFGTRIIGIMNLYKTKLYSNSYTQFLWFSLLAGLIIPMLFLQKGTPWNTIQFVYYSQFFMGLIAAVALGQDRFTKKPVFRILLGLMIIVLTLPTTFDTLKHYLPARPPSNIPVSELEVLSQLSKLPPGRVLTPVFFRQDWPAPRPLYVYESTAYVSAISGQKVFLEDEVNLDITGYDWRQRRDQVIEFFKSNNLDQSKMFIKNYALKYIYLPDVANNRPVFSASQLGGRVIFENSQVALWQVSD